MGVPRVSLLRPGKARTPNQRTLYQGTTGEPIRRAGRGPKRAPRFVSGLGFSHAASRLKKRAGFSPCGNTGRSRGLQAPELAGAKIRALAPDRPAPLDLSPSAEQTRHPAITTRSCVSGLTRVAPRPEERRICGCSLARSHISRKVN